MARRGRRSVGERPVEEKNHRSSTRFFFFLTFFFFFLKGFCRCFHGCFAGFCGVLRFFFVFRECFTGALLMFSR